MSTVENPFRYFRRNGDYLLFERGIDLCPETVRLWWNRLGPLFPADMKRHGKAQNIVRRQAEVTPPGMIASGGEELASDRRLPTDHFAPTSQKAQHRER